MDQPGAYHPLEAVLLADDFSRGLNGWSPLIGNYEHSLDSVLPDYADLRPPQLSNLTMWDTGTAGALTGPYALKLATRPRKGGLAVGIKRTTFRERGPVRLECYFTAKPEATRLELSELDVRSFGVLFDIHDEGLRYMPHLRYLNAIDGKRIGKWQFKPQTRAFRDIGTSGKTVSHFHLGPEGWEDVPGGEQLLCYNEIATKMNWHYLRIDLDLESRRFLGFRCNDRAFSGEGMKCIEIPPMNNLWCMLNIGFWVETDTDQRSLFYIDSVRLSATLRED